MAGALNEDKWSLGSDIPERLVRITTRAPGRFSTTYVAYQSSAMAGALTPEQRAIVEAADTALDEFGKQIVAVWFQSGAVKCAECGVVHGHHLGCSHFSWTGFKYSDEHIPTERLGVPTAPVQTQRCECGSGSNEASGAHSHWCPRRVSK